MKEITRTKRLEVAHYYLLGYTYREIEEETGISHGSIANIVSELEDDDLKILGTTFDQVNDLRQLSFDLKKSGLKPSQALLGITFLKRLQDLQITSEHLEVWSSLVKKLLPPDFPAEEFFEAAIRLQELENTQGESFENLTTEYTKLKQGIEKQKQEIDSLSKRKAQLSDEIKPLPIQVDTLKKERDSLKNGLEMSSSRLQDLNSRVKEAEEEKARLDRETRDLKRRRVKLSSEVDGKEESLKAINALGFTDEDLLRLRAFLKRTSKSANTSLDKVKHDLFSAFTLFKDISGLESKREVETQRIKELTREKAALEGEILALEKQKGVLEGEITQSASSTLQIIRDSGTQTSVAIKQNVADIDGQFKKLLADVLKAGEAVAELRQMVRRGEVSQGNFREFMKELRSRLE